MEKSIKNERKRLFSLVSYLEDAQILSIINQNRVRIKSFAYIYHDQDNNTPHFHILIYCVNPQYVKTIERWFTDNQTQNTFVEPGHNPTSLYLYLCHRNKDYDGKDGKTVYPFDNIKTDSQDFWLDSNTIEDSRNIALNIVNDIINKVSMRTLLSRYGREIVIHYEKYKDFAMQLDNQENAKTFTEVKNKDDLPF